jgi:hypothetical protein
VEHALNNIATTTKIIDLIYDLLRPFFIFCDNIEALSVIEP